MYKIGFGTNSGDKGTYPHVFSPAPSREQAKELITAWAVWEVEAKVSYISSVVVLPADINAEIKNIKQEISEKKQTFKQDLGYDYADLKTIFS